MAVEVFATTPNQGITVLNGALSDSATTIPVDSMADLKLTGLTGSDFAYCKITKTANWRQHPINRKESFEIIKVTAVSANDLTATRGVDGTSGTTFADGDIVEVVFSSIHYQDIVDAITDGTAELNIGTLTVAVGDVKITNGELGIGVSPAVGIHLQEAVPIIRVDNTSAGLTTIARGMSGVELMAMTMNETSKFTGGVKFMSTDSAFVTDNPKLLGLVVGRATEAYAADTDGGMATDFFTSPNDVGASSAPVLAMTLDQNGDLIHRADMYWVGAGTGLGFAGISVKDNASVSTLNSAAKVQFVHFDTDNASNNVVPDHTNNHITIPRDGAYMIICDMAVENSAGTSHKIDVSVWKNNGATELENVHNHRDLDTGSDVGAIPLAGLAILSVSDTLEVWLDTDSGTNRNIIVEDCTLTAIQIGGS